MTTGMQAKGYLLVTTALLGLLLSTIQVRAVLTGVGDIGFVGVDAGNTDSWAFVTFVDIGDGETIVFNENEGDGAGGFNNDSEGRLTWTAPAGGVAAATVIEISAAGTASASIGTVAESGSFTPALGGDSIVAYLGTLDTPSAFLSLFNYASASSDANFGALTGTGLAYGVDAIDFSVAAAGHDFFEYTGPTTFASVAAARAAINDTDLWAVENTSGEDDGTNGVGPDLPFDATAFRFDAGGPSTTVPATSNTGVLFALILPPFIWLSRKPRQ